MECENKCNGVGNCNYDIGKCDCPAGYSGSDCSLLQLRPCTNRYRDKGNVSTSHIDRNGRDLDWTTPGWMASRCPGICDATIAACYCDGPVYGHVPPPLGSPPGTPPIKAGRMLADSCFPKETPEGSTVSWGNKPLDELYGPEGWCMHPSPVRSCGCGLDGYYGDACDRRHEMVCPNQCSGRGECWLGFCRCHEGWYGLDCARKRAGAEVEPSVLLMERPWLRSTVHVPLLALEFHPHLHPTPGTAAGTPVAGTAAGTASVAGSTAVRKRPLIYVYDIPAQYTTRMLQYRIQRRSCVYRRYNSGNSSVLEEQNLYGLESYLHEVLLQSDHRTFDPQEADYFYVPAYTSCLIYPVFAWADEPWFAGPMQLRVLQAANMLLQVKQYIQSSFPFWNRTQGRDHIWLANHDEGACWFPTEIYNTSIILTHWGRLDPDHVSHTAFGWDNYSQHMPLTEWMPQDWRELHRGHACYTPGKDLVIPSLKFPHHFLESPLLGSPPRKRNILLYFKGDVGTTRPNKWYSRGIRQKLYNLSKEHKWRQRYNIQIGGGSELPEPYSLSLARSVFCLVAPGDGWSSRAEDSVLHGCIPLVVMDEVHAVYESILDWDAFSVRVKEGALDLLPEILLSIPEDRISRMQQRLSRVWHRFAYTQGKLMRALLMGAYRSPGANDTAAGPPGPPAPSHPSGPSPPGSPPLALLEDDALGTILSWLYSKMQHSGAKGGQGGQQA